MSEISAHTREAYAKIVDGILATADLDSVSSKQIRLRLQSVVGKDLSAQKSAINKLIVSRFDKAAESQSNGNDTPRDSSLPLTNVASPAVSNGVAVGAKEASESRSPTSTKREASSDTSDVLDDAPPKKRPKPSAMETDAALAARLQAEEDRRSRATRGGGARTRRPPVKASTTKKSAKAKSASKVSAKDDSDLDSGSAEEKPVKRNGAFHKPLNLSEPLSQLLGGETQLSRPQTVKKIWEYVRENGLQNPEDKRQIRCDDAMRAVFKQDSVHMFSMNKILSKHLYPVAGEE